MKQYELKSIWLDTYLFWFRRILSCCSNLADFTWDFQSGNVVEIEWPRWGWGRWWSYPLVMTNRLLWKIANVSMIYDDSWWSMMIYDDLQIYLLNMVVSVAMKLPALPEGNCCRGMMICRGWDRHRIIGKWPNIMCGKPVEPHKRYEKLWVIMGQSLVRFSSTLW